MILITTAQGLYKDRNMEYSGISIPFPKGSRDGPKSAFGSAKIEIGDPLKLQGLKLLFDTSQN